MAILVHVAIMRDYPVDYNVTLQLDLARHVCTQQTFNIPTEFHKYILVCSFFCMFIFVTYVYWLVHTTLT